MIVSKQLARNLMSVKVWILGLVTALLIEGTIHQGTWLYVVVALLGYREVSSIAYQKLTSKIEE